MPGCGPASATLFVVAQPDSMNAEAAHRNTTAQEYIFNISTPLRMEAP
jgi:hypothetical protein